MGVPVGQAVFIVGGTAADIPKDQARIRKPTIGTLRKTYDDGHALTLNDYDKLANKIEKLNANQIKTKEPLLWRMYYGLDSFVDCLEFAADQGNLIGAFWDWVFAPGQGTESSGPR